MYAASSTPPFWGAQHQGVAFQKREPSAFFRPCGSSSARPSLLPSADSRRYWSYCQALLPYACRPISNRYERSASKFGGSASTAGRAASPIRRTVWVSLIRAAILRASGSSRMPKNSTTIVSRAISGAASRIERDALAMPPAYTRAGAALRLLALPRAERAP